MIVTFDKQYKPWLAASNDDTRPALCQVWVDPDGWLFATDTHCLVVVRCEIEEAPEGFNGCGISAEWLKVAARFYRGLKNRFTLEVDPPTKDTPGKAEVITTYGTMATRLEYTGDVAPAVKKAVQRIGWTAQETATRHPQAMFNPLLVAKLKDALGVAKSKGLVIDHSDALTPAFLFGEGCDEAFAILMPKNCEAWRDNAKAQALPAEFISSRPAIAEERKAA